MILLRFLEVAAVVLLVWVLLFQVLIPAARRRPMFPMFRKVTKLEEDLARARETGDERELEKQINEARTTKERDE